MYLFLVSLSLFSFQNILLRAVPILSKISCDVFLSLWKLGSILVETLDEISLYDGSVSFSLKYYVVYERGLCTLLFSVIIELPEKRGYFVVFLFINMRDYRNMFSGGGCYSHMNHTLMIQFYPFICIVRRSIFCSSIIPILLTFVILWRLVIWPLLLSKIIWCHLFLYQKLQLCSILFPLERCGWGSINIHKK